MTAYSEWTLAQQKMLWRQLADDALARWGMGARAISWLGYSSNAVFKVKADAGDCYVLRLQPSWRANRAQVRSELAWLRLIRHASSLQAPFPVAAAGMAGDALLVEIAHPQLPPPHSALACLFKYIQGECKPARALQYEDVCAIGTYLAQLHSLEPVDSGADFGRPRLDARGIFGVDSPYASQCDFQALPIAQREVCEAVARVVENALSQLNRQDAFFGLIHADLLAKNILFTDSGLAALDFEYCAWGCYLYDLAPLLWQLKGERPDDYAQLEASLWVGYTASLGCDHPPRDYLETFVAARQLASCRWLLNNRDHPQIRELTPALLRGRIDELRDFLECGKLQRRTATL
ncbi:MAG: phosphotransferase [Chloroflexi bacterium]|nr:phosphotransferase [Chloroflexota bacterium]